MKTIKLHRTASATWRLLIDGAVNPLMVGFHMLTPVIVKMMACYGEVGPIYQESLRDLDNDLKARAELWDGDDKYNLDIANARQLLNDFIQQEYGSKKQVPSSFKLSPSAMSDKHNPTDADVVKWIMKRNPYAPNLRLSEAKTDRITYGIVMDNTEGRETWVVGAAYDEDIANDYLIKIKKLLGETIGNENDQAK